jgi:hypothetical protein
MNDSANVTHTTNCLLDEQVRQASEASALATFLAAGASGMAAYKKAVADACVVDARARLASAIANGVPVNPFQDALFCSRGTFY